MTNTPNSMRWMYVLLLLLAFSFDATGQSSQSPPAKPTLQGQEISPDDVVRVNTTLVGVPVTVLDRQGRLVPNLKQEDFHLYENGVEQQITHFAPVNVPVTVLLLFDNRLLDAPRKLVSNLHELAMTFADQMRPGDRVLVAKFGEDKFEILRKTKDDGARVLKEPHKVKWHFGSSIHDAVDAAIRYMNGIPGRKAIVLFSDGLLHSVIEVTEAMPSGRIISRTETKPREKVTPQHTLNEAEESDAPIYVMQYDTMTDMVRNGPQPGTREWQWKDWMAGRRNDYRIADEYLHSLAEKSGARLYPVGKPPELTEAFTQISAELSQQYSLGYYPKTLGQPGERREIRVRVQRPDLVVRSRTTYVYTPPKK
jgi:Ca-activated chloride channel family protein